MAVPAAPPLPLTLTLPLSPGGGEGQGEGVDSNALRIVGRWEIPRTDC